MEVDLLERFEAHLRLEDDLSDNTVRAYESDLRQYLRYLKGLETPVWEATRREVAGFLIELTGGGMSSATRQRRLSAVRHLYRFALREGLVAANPTEFIPRIRKRRGLPVVLSIPEVRRLLEAFPARSPLAVRDRTILEALYGAGLRVSELLDLDLGDIDLVERWIRCRGKGGRTRFAPVGDYLAQWLARYLKEARGRLATPRSAEALFLNSRGGRLSRKGCWRIVSDRGARLEGEVRGEIRRQAARQEERRPGEHQLQGLCETPRRDHAVLLREEEVGL